ncbi:hypothetical protein L249_6981 [Ophiocordyceps polyrhachis-furcata BCC 54312]|uniref:Armadillo repeat-containing protein 8 n=1 Tax=Ophiocordyceps polyrhachis-furcata BCC 54312 TaxID=1330021 RepID=A0A367LLS6_9HYPO|nr:hypothetical protein L249_6981 [Ophiocordyceps polyrhachis-furcata BCC 54312]
MASPLGSPILAQLRSAKSYPEQAAALRLLKNEIVGHIQKKEAWIASGVLDPIVSTLVDPSCSPTRLNGKDARLQLATRPLSDEETVKLHALQLIASFANGGPTFLSPLSAAHAVPAILANGFSPHVNPPQIVVAALRALTEIARAAALASPSSPLDTQSLADSLLVPQHMESLNIMLSFATSNHLVQSQVTLAADLISRLCREERHQHALVVAGVLDSLASQLARFAVRDGLVIPGAEEMAYSDGLYEVFPQPAGANAAIGPILEAIAAILGDSKYRANRLVYSPALLAIFPLIKRDPERRPPSHQHLHFNASYAMDYLVPAMPVTPPRNPSAANPPPERFDTSPTSSRTSLSKFGTAAIWDSPRNRALGEGATEEAESPVVPWLFHQVRGLAGYDRLMAAAVLAAVLKADLGRKCDREKSIGLLIIPLLIDMLEKIDKDKASEGSDSDTAAKRLLLERAPAVLARLMTDSDYAQQAAFDAGVVKVLSRLLRGAYQPVPLTEQPKYWSPQADAVVEPGSGSGSSQLGDGGQNALLAHHLKLRESTLQAMGALAAGKEEYRKALVAEDVVPYVVESLWEFPRKPRQVKERPKDRQEPARKGPSAAYGTNTVSILVASCHVVRMLARSVSILRTALVDYAVAMPIFRFLKHDDINVQIAATATIINLVVEVSPVREVNPLPPYFLLRRPDFRHYGRKDLLTQDTQLLTEQGVMTVLCQHAHSDKPGLRLNALWGLKHFVDAVGPELKRASLKELEPEWLVQLICDDSHDAALQEARLRETGEDSDGDADMETQQPFRWLHAANGAVRELDSSRSTRLRQAEERLTAILEAEVNPTRRARSEDVAIQEQGLDFIRNLIGRPEAGASSETPSETTEMIDFLLAELGQERLFEILASKLRSKKLHPVPRRTGPREAARVLHPQARIIVAVIYILVHMAASIPRHRQLVVEQTDVFKLLVQQTNNKDREVRVALCHLIINLTWQDDEGDAQKCATRAHELRRLGFLNKMETLKQHDRDLDVRERAKTAAWQLEPAAAPGPSY